MSPADLVVVAGFLLAALVWGLWPKKGGGGYGDYLVGGRGVAWPILLLSIVATETSTVTFLSLPGQSFVAGGDLSFLQITLGYVVGRFIVIWLLLPVFFRSEIFTAYEILEERFGKRARTVASGLFLACRTLADGLRLLLAGLALEQMLGWPFNGCVVLVTAVTAVYAIAGGVRSVVWNDAMQLVVYTTGALVAAALIIRGVPGGFAGILEFGAETGRWRWFDPSVGITGGQMTFWTGLVGGAFLSIATHGVDHLMVQRYLCAKSQRSAAVALGLSGPVVALQFLLFLTIGVGLAAFYASNPGGDGLTGDQAFAAFLASETPIGVRGLLCASVLAAGMSTLSSSLNASAGVLVNDIFRVGEGPDSEARSGHAVFWAQCATAFFAVLQLTVAIAARALAYEASVIGMVLAVAGFTTGVIAGLFVLGAILRSPSPTIAIVALGAGAAQGVAMFAWNTAVDNDLASGPKINPWWNSLLAVTVTVGAGLITSALTRRRVAYAGALLVTLAPAGHAVAEGLPVVAPAEVGIYAPTLDAIDAQVEAAREAGEFAGCVVAIGRGERIAFLRAYGDRQIEPERRPMRPDTVFDLASLTKPVATATSVFCLIERGEVRLADRIGQHLPAIEDESASGVTVEMLLTHHTGHIPDNPLEDYRHGVDEAWRRLFALKPKTEPGTRFIYSDVNFELLGKLVETVSGTPLDRFAAERVFRPLGMIDTTFVPGESLRKRAAATEPRDGEMLVGVVHDPRSALLGGVAGHAGLFSTAGDLARYAAMLLGKGSLDGARVLGPATVREMTRPRQVSGSRRAAGWDVLSGYSSNRGELMSDAAFGHGGFTGTALWIDPEYDLFVIFLSNRLHPDGSGSVNHLAGRIGSIAAASILAP